MGTKQVVVIHDRGLPSEQRHELEAHVQPETGFFEVSAPVYEDDYVEFDDARGGRTLKYVETVNVYDVGSPTMQHIEAKWGKPPSQSAQPQLSPAVHLTLPELKELERFLDQLHRAEDAGELDGIQGDDLAELTSDVATLDAQLKSPRPKRAVVREALSSVRNIVEGAAGGGLVLAAQHLLMLIS